MRKKSIALLISCFDWYDKRLKYIGKYLENKGYRVEYISSNFDHLNKIPTNKYEYIKHFHYITVPRYSSNISVKRIISHKIFSVKVSKMIKKVRPNLVYCLIPPNSLTKDIAILKKKLSFKLIYDVIDFWPESFPRGNAQIFPYNMWRYLRDGYINCADSIILECNFYKSILKDIIPAYKMEVIPIIKPKIKDVKYKEFTEDICLGYLGSINSLIDMDKISEIVKELTETKRVLVRIVGDGKNKDIFIQKLKTAGAKVEFYGPVFDDIEKKRILGLCDFGLNIYKDNIKIGLTLKSVDYFQLSLPILNTIPGDTAELVNSYEIGVNKADLNQFNILKKLDEIEVLKNNVTQMFDKEFTPQSVNNKLEKILSDMLDK